MAALAQSWRSYGELLVRLLPTIEHCAFATPDGEIQWASATADLPLLRSTLSILRSSTTRRQYPIDGLADGADTPEPRYGFRVRDADGDVLGLVLLATRGSAADRPDLAAVFSLVRPALECLQNELAAAVGKDALQGIAAGSESLRGITALAAQRVTGIGAVMLVPERDLTILHTDAESPAGLEGQALRHLNRHLTTRARLHGCTLAANKLAVDGAKSVLPYKAISTPLRDAHRRVIGVLAVFRRDTDGDFQARDAEALELLARRAEQVVEASFDACTGLLTQAAFLAQTKAKLGIRAPNSHALLYIDVDQLNIVNENHGMNVGDELIQNIADLLRRRSRENALVARLGGDRFAMFLSGCGVEPAARIAEELRAGALRLSGARAEIPLLVSLSIGVSRIGDGDPDLGAALADAQAACRLAKDRGRNRVEMSSGRERPGARAPIGIIDYVALALQRDWFELLAQPILPLGGIPADLRFEVLLRMRAADGSRLSFGKLLGAAPAHLMRDIDRWVIEHALTRLCACREVLCRHPARFSLNVSAASLADAQFWYWLEERLRASRLEPGTVAFEFPEEAAGQLGGVAARMIRLREQGVAFALDNFGRDGALARMRLLPVSCIKIDGSLTRGVSSSSRSRSTVLAICELAKSSGLETIATQVETDAVRAEVQALGVEYGQGFFIGKPLALDEALGDLPLYSCFSTSTGLFDTIAPKHASSGI